MDQPAHESPLENYNIREMVHKNSVERLEYLKRQRSIEKQKKYFVRQHSRDENEIKQILQRLQLEQHFHDQEQCEDVPTSDVEEDYTEEVDDDFGMINPYPLIIAPKFGPPTPLKDAHTEVPNKEKVPFGARMGRRKSLEYEDIDPKVLSKNNAIRTTVLAYSFINKLKAPINARKCSSQDPGPLIDNDMWVGDPEYISSIRRPRKSVAELNHNKVLKRAKSEIWLKTDNVLSRSTPTLRPESPRQRKRSNEDVAGKVNDFKKGVTDTIEKTSPVLKRKNSREKKSDQTCKESSPNSSPRMRRIGSWKGDKKHSEKKFDGEKSENDLEKSVISVNITNIATGCQMTSSVNDDTESLKESANARKGSLKGKKSCKAKNEKVEELQHEPKRKSSLKKKKMHADILCKSDKTEKDFDTENKRNRKISFADQEMTRHGSLKNKSQRKCGVVTAPGSLEDIKSGNGDDNEAVVVQRKPRSKSTGSSPARSPAANSLSSNKSFKFP